ncbi:hypothetical protein BAE44_0025415 [Dichanthelium oligosanthes]|uniref:Uncharacterized protein n=1 Tax=Dichanthelium oligosanthes TaxID=888268 RepID=A0A1E5UL20_9POAL|nr:hypothetical protein BAE44_0025415 [Dichanthelium oligosanthes]
MAGARRAAAAVTVFAAAVLVAVSADAPGDSLADLGGAAKEIESAPEVKNLGPWAKGLLKGMPAAAAGPEAMAPVAKYPLVLAEDRTRRPDVLHHLKMYEGGWNVTNKHYWAEFLDFFLLPCGSSFLGWPWLDDAILNQEWPKERFLMQMPAGCIVLLYGQSKFHKEATRTVNFVVNQSDFTIQSLRNVTEYLSLAKTITVAALYLPSDVQGQIDSLKGDLNKAADTISQKTSENYIRIRKVLHIMSVVLICIAVLLPVLAFLGYVLELYGPRYTVYIFVTLCCKMVAALFILLGIFLILNSAAKDTCEAMDQWAQQPQAETALSNILPCVDESTTNRTLYQSKEIVVMLVRIVNRAISALSNRRPHHKHPGQLMPYLCSPYDSNFNDRQCKPREVTFENATTAWQNYTCLTQDTDLCSGNKTLTPEIYGQLVLAANVSYALYHYAPVLLNFQDCKFVRATFSAIASQYCPPMERDLGLVSAGLVLIASGLVLYLVWMLFADRPQREEVSDLASVSRITPVDSSPLQ